MINPKDPSDMYSMIANYPAQFAKGLQLAAEVKLSPDISEVIVAGIGGSALAPDIVFDFFKDELIVPVSVHRSYDLPKKVSAKTLVIAISFSGNTEETLSAATAAIEQGAKIVAIASGGKLAELSKESSFPLVLLTEESENFQPRMSSGYVIAVVTQLLVNARILPSSACRALLDATESLSQMELSGAGQRIAFLLAGKTPLIYAPDSYWPVARIAKIKINENSKVPCFWNVLPEMNHNEMVGFTNLQGARYFALILQDPEGNPLINHRMEILANVLKEKGIGSQIILMPGSNRYEKTLGTLMLIDWVSYYLALALGIDPTPVEMVEKFKAIMAK